MELQKHRHIGASKTILKSGVARSCAQQHRLPPFIDSLACTSVASRRRENMVGVNMVLAEFVQFKHGLYKSYSIECLEGVMLEPCLLQPSFHVAGHRTICLCCVSMPRFWKLLTNHRIAGWARQATLPRSMASNHEP